jgi:hypothetical protein
VSRRLLPCQLQKKKHARSTLSTPLLPEAFLLRDESELEIADATLRAELHDVMTEFKHDSLSWGDYPSQVKGRARSLPEAFLLRDKAELELADVTLSCMIWQVVGPSSGIVFFRGWKIGRVWRAGKPPSANDKGWSERVGLLEGR